MTKVTQISFEDEGGPGRRRIHLREISGDSDAPLETVGQDLRAARLRRGDDLATVSRVLKIRRDHLEAVEQDNLAALPGRTYAIGFVRSYCGYLGLDTAQTVERYKQEISGRHDEHQPAATTFHEEETRRLPSGWRILAGVVGLALLYGAWHLVSAGPSPQPVPPAPSLALAHPQIVAAAKPVPPPSVTPAATSNTAVYPPAVQQTAPAGAPPRNNPLILGSGDVGTSQTIPKAIPSTAVPAVPVQTAQHSEQGQVYGKLNVNPRVVLRAQSEARLTVRGADGTLYLNKDLKSGDSYQVPNITGLSMATSDAGAVDVVLDGVEMGRAGQSQQILGHISLDPQSLVDRFETH